MVNKLVSSFLILVVVGCAAHRLVDDGVRRQPKGFFKAPGVLWLRDSLFIDETEVTNFYYSEYLFWLKRNRPSAYRIALPDTTVWLSYPARQQELFFYSYLHPGLRDYPVVGITDEQARRYCEWRTDLVNCMLYNSQKGIKHWRYDTTITYPKRVRYRLPTKHEWTYAATAGLDTTDYPWGMVKRDISP